MGKNFAYIVLTLLICVSIPALGMKKIKFPKNVIKNKLLDNKRLFSTKKSIAKKRYRAQWLDRDGFNPNSTLENIIKNELTMAYEENPNLTINEMIPEALKNAEIRVRNEIIPQRSERLVNEYGDNVSKQDYSAVLNEELDYTLKHNIKDAVKAETLQRKLSKELNIPLSPFNKKSTGFFDLVLKDKESIAKDRYRAQWLDRGSFNPRESLDNITKNELTMMYEGNPNLTINEMISEALKNAEIRVRSAIIPQQSERFVNEYNDEVSKQDYSSILNQELDKEIEYNKDRVKAGTLQRKLSKELNIPLSPFNKKSTGYFDLVLKDKQSIAGERYRAQRLDINGFNLRRSLDNITKNELTMMYESNPNLTINEMISEALKNAERRVRSEIIPQQSERFVNEYGDEVSKQDYSVVLNEMLDGTLKFNIKDEVKAGRLQRKLSKELNIPLGQTPSFFQEIKKIFGYK